MELVGCVQPQAYRDGPVEVPCVLMQRTGKLGAEGESDFWGSLSGAGMWAGRVEAGVGRLWIGW